MSYVNPDYKSKKEFKAAVQAFAAARLVKTIRDAGFTDDVPTWAVDDPSNLEYTRAVQTAEAFIILFSQFNPRFNERQFLTACGLVK